MPASNPLPRGLRALRRAKGWTQSQLARAVESSRRAVIDWEMGRRAPARGTWLKLFVLLYGCPQSRRALRW